MNRPSSAIVRFILTLLPQDFESRRYDGSVLFFATKDDIDSEFPEASPLHRRTLFECIQEHQKQQVSVARRLADEKPNLKGYTGLRLFEFVHTKRDFTCSNFFFRQVCACILRSPWLRSEKTRISRCPNNVWFCNVEEGLNDAKHSNLSICPHTFAVHVMLDFAC